MNSYTLFIGLLLLLPLKYGYSQSFSSLGAIFNFEIGDEFHIKKFNCCNDVFFEIEEITIIEKNVLDEGFSFIRNINCYHFVNAESPILTDTAFMNRMDTLLINHPDSIIFQPDDEIYQDISMYNGRKVCIKHTTFMGKPFLYKYVDGCGLAVTTCIVLPDSLCRNADSLIYFKKGSESWGESILAMPEYESGKNNFTLFPNPCSDKLNLRLPAECQNAKIIISNVEGVEQLSLMLEPHHLDSKLDLSKLKKGVYLLQLNNKNHYWVSRIIKF